MRHLRNMGLGKTSIESTVLEESQNLIAEIRKRSASHPLGVVDFKQLFHVPIINIVWSMIAGERFRRDDPRSERLLNDIDAFFREGNPVRVGAPIPAVLLDKFPKLREYFGVRTEMFEPLQEFIKVLNLLRTGFNQINYPLFFVSECD